MPKYKVELTRTESRNDTAEVEVVAIDRRHARQMAITKADEDDAWSEGDWETDLDVNNVEEIEPEDDDDEEEEESEDDEEEELKLALGQVVATPGALAAMEASQDGPLDYLVRHRTGDWGIVDSEDQKTNDEALIAGNRVLSAYHLKDGTKIWIITEADRSSTTILLPDEY